MKKIVFTLFALWAWASLSHAQTLSVAQELEKGRSTLKVETLQDIQVVLEAKVNTPNASFEDRYALARTDYYLSFAYELQKQRGPGERALEKALQAALKAAQQQPDNADIHSLLADIYARKIGSYGDMFTGMDCGPKVDAENKKALALNPNNARVQASLGRQYLMAPSAFGGDLHKALACFKKSLELKPKSDETLYWLSKTYEKLKDTDQQKKALNKALKWNPENLLVKQELGALP